MFDLFRKDEKKVEYIELIYDLIFVYMIGRNSSLVHTIENGFISPGAFLGYVAGTLIVIQIWTFMSMYINRYGSNSTADHIGIFVSMYLLYYMGEGTRVHWESHFYQYNAAWALILLDIAVLYYLRLHGSCRAMPWEQVHIRHCIRMLAAEIAFIVISFPVYALTGVAIAPAAVLVGILFALLRPESSLVAVDFPHLTERAMLYVVFTFGEMIVVIASYFDGKLALSSIYFSLMAFLVVVGLFMSYGLLYDHVIDREMSTDGAKYMTLHIFLIFGLNNITAAFEFMREDAVDYDAKSAFLVASFVLYYIFLFVLARYSKNRGELRVRYILPFAGTLAGFVVLMAVCYRNGQVSIALSVLLTFLMYRLIRRYWKTYIEPMEEEEPAGSGCPLSEG